MIHLFQEALAELESLKAKVTGAATAAKAVVSSSVAWTAAELKAAEVAAFAKVDPTAFTLSQAFAEGASWAAARVQAATAEPAAAAPATATTQAASVTVTADAVTVTAPTVTATPVAAPVAAEATPAPATTEAPAAATPA
jgi:flagellar hook-length control protein FliK